MKWHWKGIATMVAIGVCHMAVAEGQSPVTTIVGAQPAHREVSPLLDRVVSVHLTHVALDVAVGAIAHAAEIEVALSDDILPAKRVVSIDANGISAGEAFRRVLEGSGLVISLTPGGKLFLTKAVRPQADTAWITGRVTDSASEKGVNGATVFVQGTKLSVLTGEGGQFVLRGVPVGDLELTVRMFGYKAATRSVKIGESGRVVVNFVVVPITTVLSGVVTTATGIQSKMSVGSDITTINVDSVMKTAPITSVTDLLENRVPGLTVVHTSGTPGDPSRLLLRGASSVLGSNNPIVVVDGVRVYDPQNLGSVQNQIMTTQSVAASYTTASEGELARPSPLDQIDPNTIATIEVLKGPSASALYGSDAANGVIVITTKKGQPGKTSWSVSANQGISYVPGSYPTFTYAFGHAIGLSGEQQCVAGVTNVGSYPCIIDSVRTFQALNDSRFSPLTSGPRSSASATVSGGAQALTYSFTGSAQNTHGMTKLPSFAVDQYTAAVGSAPPPWMARPDDYVGWSGSGQVQATLSPQATLTIGDMLSSSTQHRTSLGLSAVGSLVSIYVDTTNVANTPAYSDFFTQITQATLTSTTNATLNWRIRPWLPLTVTGGYNRTQETDKQYLSAGLPAAILPTAGDTTGSYDLGTQQASVATLNMNTTIPLPLGNGRALQLAAGTNFVSQSTTGQDISTTQVPVGVSDPTTFPQTTSTSVYQATQSSATYGWFAEPQLQLHSRLFITPGIRLDGGTASGGSAGLSIFPKTSLSYIAVDRTGGTTGSGWTHALDQLRLRGTFGIAGVQPTPGQALRLFNTPNVVSLDGGVTSTSGTLLKTLGNTLLHPERSRELEMGFDAVFLQNRLTLTATYYNKLRIDAIEFVPVAPSAYGNSVSYYANVGNIRNTGYELTSQLRVIDRSAVTWNLTGQLSSNKNLVVSTSGASACGLGGNASIRISQGTCVVAGYPLGAKFSGVVLGSSDMNHDGVIETNEFFLSDSSVFLGGPDPRYTASLSTTITLWHGRVSLAAQADYQDGLTQSSSLLRNYFESSANQPNASAYAQANGVEALISNYYNLNSMVINSLRLDGLSINVTLPDIIARAFRAQQATLAVQGSNLGLWTNYVGKDPSVNSYISGVNVYDAGGLPQPRVWQLAMRITQ